MKVKIGNYPNRMICRIHDRYMENKHGYFIDAWDQSMTWDEKLLERLDNAIQWVYNHTINLYIDRSEQTVNVKIDSWDTWSMDYTLAHIVLPMLVQLKRTKHGAPIVDTEDVPVRLHPTEEDLENCAKNGTTDTKFFARWEWVLDEMIWAFDQKCRDDWQSDYYGEYIPHPSGEFGKGEFEWTDDEGRQKHQERMSNGFRLFGKYYESLWD